MKTEEKLNLTMLCDFYELTMGNGYFRAGLQDRITYFDVFFRNVPDNGGFAVCAGLEQLVQYIQNLHFDEEDIAFLRDKHLFSEDFLSYLRDFRFTGDIWAVPEGTPIFPREPVVTVRAPAIQAPGPGHGRRHLRSPGGLYRRLRRHRLHDLRPAVRRTCRRHHGPFLGPDVRQPV